MSKTESLRSRVSGRDGDPPVIASNVTTAEIRALLEERDDLIEEVQAAYRRGIHDEREAWALAFTNAQGDNAKREWFRAWIRDRVASVEATNGHD